MGLFDRKQNNKALSLMLASSCALGQVIANTTLEPYLLTGQNNENQNRTYSWLHTRRTSYRHHDHGDDDYDDSNGLPQCLEYQPAHGNVARTC